MPDPSFGFAAAKPCQPQPPLNTVLRGAGGVMNWEMVGAMAEITGAIAVVISIGYLAVQIRSNTRTMRSTSGFDATHSWATANETAIALPDEYIVSMSRAFSGEPWEEFSEIERGRLVLGMRVLFQKLEGQYFLYKYGNLDEGLWDARSSWAAGVIRIQFFKRWWEVEKLQRVYSEEFIQILEAADPIAVAPEIMGSDAT